MSQEFEKGDAPQLASALHEKPKKSYKKVYILIVTLLVVLGLSVFVYAYTTRSKSPLAAYKDTVGFQLYYPEQIPNGYTLDNKSMSDTGGVLFYTLQKSENSIVVSQQKSPSTSPDFNILKESLDFKDIETEIGSAVSGMNTEKPIAILLTNTTLINVNGSKDVPSDIIIELIKSMRSL